MTQVPPIRDEDGELFPIPVDIGNEFENERWINVKGFPEVPMSVLDFSKWKTVYSGPWRYVDNILLLEARALEKREQNRKEPAGSEYTCSSFWR